MATVQDIDENTAASLVLHVLTRQRDVSLMRKSGLFGLFKKVQFDIIVEKVHRSSDQYGCWTFYAVRGGKCKSSQAVFAEVIVKEVIKQLFDFATGQMSPTVDMAQNLSGAIGAGSIDTKGIYEQARKLGGAMQLHAARKMGKRAYDQCRIFGLTADVRYGGAVRFEIKRDSGKAYLDIWLCSWSGLSTSAGWVDRFKEAGGQRFGDIENYSSTCCAHYTYSPGAGFEQK